MSEKITLVFCMPTKKKMFVPKKKSPVHGTWTTLRWFSRWNIAFLCCHALNLFVQSLTPKIVVKSRVEHVLVAGGKSSSRT